MATYFSRPLLCVAVGSIGRLLLLSFAFATLVGFREPLEGPFQGRGSEAPDAYLVDLEGRSLTLSGVASGWTLIKFATTWCPRCDDQVEELNRMALFLERQGVRVLEVYVREPAHAVLKEVEKLKRQYRSNILLDPNGETVILYGLRIIPRLFLVDPDGIVRVDTRFLEAPQLERRIEHVLLEQEGGRHRELESVEEGTMFDGEGLGLRSSRTAPLLSP